ncbi:hypothetical protein P153DRAFT_383623 [Dothidotthia symphoricarpi CBS 119687]|uniref:Nudix hydrolase domain-containing protein n=1 Tax=Dothidotthia symphoricarpi CBS 119687 TaxID=1392245 RepID=A0A6A6AKS7_9PLEO|nr:uncharacterized protein P153DRAFT_383623 [Dothidotthia symphoricarpi CBS 119687]KAF2131524.1 hypothetical protein P153DRAFT_383623 [Dothidotthia symphoricarpi CBS 119687]
MAQSNFPTRQLSSDQFVESCGTILFDRSDPQSKRVCLVNLVEKDEWMLAKGRRNIGETRKDAALREITEETGYSCHLLPIRMFTRVAAGDEPPDTPDEALVHDRLTEPFMCTMRRLLHGKGVKLIWWYVAALYEDAHDRRDPGEEKFSPQFFSCEMAVEKLYFEPDRDVLIKAIKIVEIRYIIVHNHRTCDSMDVGYFQK